MRKFLDSKAFLYIQYALLFSAIINLFLANPVVTYSCDKEVTLEKCHSQIVESMKAAQLASQR